MKGLLLKDYYMLLKYCRPYALIVLIFGVCSLADGGNLFMLAYPAVLCGINSVSLLAYDEKSRWQQYCETMPYTRKQVDVYKRQLQTNNINKNTHTDTDYLETAASLENI